MKKIFSIVLLFAALIAVWMFRTPTMSLLSWFGNREAVVNSVEQLGMWGPLVLIILLILQVFLAFIPGQALMIACGYIYGFWGGLLISWLGLFGGGQAAFFLARRLADPLPSVGYPQISCLNGTRLPMGKALASTLSP